VVEAEGNDAGVRGLIKVRSLIGRIDLNQDGRPDPRARSSPLYLNSTLSDGKCNYRLSRLTLPLFVHIKSKLLFC